MKSNTSLHLSRFDHCGIYLEIDLFKDNVYCVLQYNTAHTIFHSTCPRLQHSSVKFQHNPKDYVSNVNYTWLYKCRLLPILQGQGNLFCSPKYTVQSNEKVINMSNMHSLVNAALFHHIFFLI